MPLHTLRASIGHCKLPAREPVLGGRYTGWEEDRRKEVAVQRTLYGGVNGKQGDKFLTKLFLKSGSANA